MTAIGDQVRMLDPYWNSTIKGFLGTIVDDTTNDRAPGRWVIKLDDYNPMRLREFGMHDHIVYADKDEFEHAPAASPLHEAWQ